MKEKLELLQQRAVEEIEQVGTNPELQELRTKLLGKKGELTEILRGMGALSAEERPAIGLVVNEVRGTIEGLLEQKQQAFAGGRDGSAATDGDDRCYIARQAHGARCRTSTSSCRSRD